MRDAAPSGIEAIPIFRWGTHVCQAFEDADDLRQVLVPYFTEGLANNESCFWVTGSPLKAAEARAALLLTVSDLGDRERAGQIEIRDASDWYKPGERINPDELIVDLLRREREALDRGYEGLRTNGNCSWVADGQRPDFQRYEELVQKTVKGRRMVCMCSYGPHQTADLLFTRSSLATISCSARKTGKRKATSPQLRRGGPRSFIKSG